MTLKALRCLLFQTEPDTLFRSVSWRFNGVSDRLLLASPISISVSKVLDFIPIRGT